MEYSHSDENLAWQPIGYWAWAAHKAAVTFIRTALAEHDLTQPRWWVLNQLVEGDKTRAEVTAILEGYLDVGADLQPEIDAVLDRGWAVAVPGRLAITDDGRALHAKIALLQRDLRARIHEGIPDEEYVRTLKVLQRMIHNVGGKAWHH
ncbi:MarR family winged helix-turn-helix transcriptional regulator [Allokutzneria sp. A3M-2-11 16]|uniref:MarR family winged helix-turn-helix transcriptional regulator n=1 Tax=Allokutzneria sp. A3M-2-11 16 TaxID=2962043 RepID=UPI0020B8723C|nr:MarR family winged helix-turn-helix transcriptional regulator [Allokutzneria sp. A3M-2-11 16]MCP3801330.1 MarR family winged helix-turn-helix transcriptional regulator [Allokutzneria sp. A3M-2-11 16]